MYQIKNMKSIYIILCCSFMMLFFQNCGSFESLGGNIDASSELQNIESEFADLKLIGQYASSNLYNVEIENTQGVQSVDIFLNNSSSVVSTISEAPFSFELDTLELPEGVNELKYVISVNFLNTKSSITRSIKFDVASRETTKPMIIGFNILDAETNEVVKEIKGVSFKVDLETLPEAVKFELVTGSLAKSTQISFNGSKVTKELPLFVTPLHNLSVGKFELSGQAFLEVGGSGLASELISVELEFFNQALPVSVAKIEKFNLMSDATRELLANLSDGLELDLINFPNTVYVEAVTNELDILKVDLSINGEQNTEVGAPYDSLRDVLKLGKNTISATAYDAEGLSVSKTITINIVDSSPEPAPPIVDSTPELSLGGFKLPSWPKSTDQSLPMSGIFYGNPYGGYGTGNTQQFHDSGSISFIAEKTGSVKAISYNNRTLLKVNISGRCNMATDPNSYWCICVKNNLDHISCGYTLPNSYSIGNGGSLDIEIREDDGSSLHRPSSKVIGRVKDKFVPIDNLHREFPVLPLASPANLIAGKLYHLYFKQNNPAPAHCRGKRTVAEAKKCPRNAGSIGFNGRIDSGYFTDAGKQGPFLKYNTVLTRNSSSGSWLKSSRNFVWTGMHYTDGVVTGDNHTAYGGDHSRDGGGLKLISGVQQVRQRFTVSQKSRRVTGVWVKVGRNSDTSAGDLNITLLNSSNSVVTSTKISSSKISKCPKVCPGNWAYVKFSAAVTLSVAKEYKLVLSAPSGSSYSTSSSFPMDYGSYMAPMRNDWKNAFAEYSSDSGKKWVSMSTKSGAAYFKERDLSLLFTIEGMPTSL